MIITDNDTPPAYLPALDCMSSSLMANGESVQRDDSVPRNGAPVPRNLEIRPHLRDALSLLLEAHDYALDLEQDCWDLAVELDVLRSAKLSNSDLRWLAGVGLIEHAVETTGPNDRVRKFRRTALVSVSEPTCVVLTSAGVAAARELCKLDQMSNSNGLATACRVVAPGDNLVQQPLWDDQRRQLRVGDDIVKEFKLPSPNQETVLMAFEEEGWPPRIDDPLPPLAQLDPRRRLHDTIKALNRKQKCTLVRFMGDGSGEGIRWEFASGESKPRAREIARALAVD